MNRNRTDRQLNWDDVRLFLAAAEAGSFRRAAESLNQGHTTVSRRMESLEQNLQTKLFNRLPTGLTLTSAGEEMARAAESLARGFTELEVKVFGQDMQAKGKIRFTAPVMILSSILLNPIVGFRQRWPEIDIEFDHSLDVLDLNANEADIAMRMTNNPSDELIGRQVGHFCEAAYASKRYLSDHRKGVEHPWIYPGGRYQFDQPLSGKWSGQLKPMITLPDPETQLSAARQHLGVATIPCMMGGQCRDLVRISPVVKRSGIWLLSHRDTRGNRRMQLFRDFLIEQMTAHRDLLEGIT